MRTTPSLPSLLLFRRASRRLVLSWLTLVVASPAFAQQAFGQGLLSWLTTAILPGLILFSVLVALGGALFNPLVAKGAVWAAVIGALLLFLARQGGALMGALN